MSDNPDSRNVTLRDIYEAVDGLRGDIGTNYVTKDAFEPVRNIVYGLVTMILVGFISAVIALIYRVH